MRRLVVISILIFMGTISNSQGKGNFHNWDKLVYNCEAKGIKDAWYADTGNGFYFGPQFTSHTWHSNGGGPVKEMGDKDGKPMHSYSISYIINVAERTMQTQGAWAWPWCHSHGYI